MHDQTGAPTLAVMERSYVKLSYDEGGATVTLANPARRNALALDVMTEVIDAFHEVAESEALAVVVAAEGPVFSAGHVCTDMMNVVQEVPQVVVAKVHALAIAAGCQLVASCDLAVAAESAAFALPGGRAGVFCHTPLVAVARQIGRKRAFEMAVTGDRISAATAAEWGLINAAVPDDELDAAVADLVARATRGSPMAKAIGKRAFYAQVDMNQPKAYAYATEVMAANIVTPDGQEGIRSFLEKRHPNFTQRG